MFHYLGLVLTIFSWIGGGYIITKWRNKDLATISKHAASSRQSLLIFAGILVGFGGLFYWWLMRWLVPGLHLGTNFTVLITITIALQMITGIAPDRDGWMQKIHRASAYSMAILYMPVAWIIGRAPGLSSSARLVCVFCITYMITAFATVVIARKAQKRYLIFQALYIVAFQLAILAAAYI